MATMEQISKEGIFSLQRVEEITTDARRQIYKNTKKYPNSKHLATALKQVDNAIKHLREVAYAEMFKREIQ